LVFLLIYKYNPVSSLPRHFWSQKTKGKSNGDYKKTS